MQLLQKQLRPAETLLSGLQDYNGRRETRLEIKAKQRGTSSERERVSETKIVTKRKARATHKVELNDNFGKERWKLGKPTHTHTLTFMRIYV
jgi:hypothetical protein